MAQPTPREQLQADKLERRLRRHLNWPARYERQMATRGWADVPPAYLLEGRP